jgi:PAS domain S-box-containing protein
MESIRLIQKRNPIGYFDILPRGFRAMEKPVDEVAKVIIEAARQPFLVLDSELHVVSANPAFCQSFRLSLPEIVGKRLGEICNCSWDIPSLTQALQGLAAKDFSFDDMEVDAEFPGLGRRIMRMNARIVARDLGPGVHTILSIEDITERIRAEAELHASELRFRRLFEASQDGVLILDAASGRIEQANPYLTNLMGYTESDLRGKELWEIGFFENSDACRRATLHLQKSGYIHFENLPLKTRDGRKIEVEFVCNKYAVGDQDKIQCNIRDVSDRKRAERALQSAEKRLRQAQKMEAIGRLAGGVAHQYNNLLTSINGYASLSLQMAEPGTSFHDNLKEILMAGERAAALTQQLLAYSRQQVLAPKLVDPNALISRVRLLLEELIGTNIDLELDLDPDVGRVKADPEQMEQALLNLVINARDAMPQGGKILLSTRRAVVDKTSDSEPTTAPAQGSYALLSITDTGAGMNEEVQARIFDPFYTTGGHGSRGLGLSMVQGIVAQSGGHVVAESEPGRGSTFKVFLPLAG